MMRLGLLTLPAVVLLLCGKETASSAGFIKSPLSEVRLTGDTVELHCEAIGRPMPEIQWWFEADDNESFSQLWDGARGDRVQINATYVFHATSTLYVYSLSTRDSGTYECRASNDPDRNHLTKSPRIKWIRSQANVIVIDPPEILTSIQDGEKGFTILGCNLTDPSLVISGHKWKKGDKIVMEDEETSPLMTLNITDGHADSSGQYTCEFQTSPVMSKSIDMPVSPHVAPYKKSEHGNEGDTGVLTCKSTSYPPVDTWTWYLESDDGIQPIVNGSDRYIIVSSGNKTVLRIDQLDIERDQGNYICNGTNTQGSSGAVITLRVRSRLAALWPFLGIVAEVLILVTIIFIYEKRRKPDEVPDDDDGAAPLKSNAGSNHDNVRQRNSS